MDLFSLGLRVEQLLHQPLQGAVWVFLIDVHVTEINQMKLNDTAVKFLLLDGKV